MLPNLRVWSSAVYGRAGDQGKVVTMDNKGLLIERLRNSACLGAILLSGVALGNTSEAKALAKDWTDDNATYCNKLGDQPENRLSVGLRIECKNQGKHYVEGSGKIAPGAYCEAYAAKPSDGYKYECRIAVVGQCTKR